MGNSSSDVYPAHVLGRSYEERQEAEFRRHCESFFRFTYRRNMPALLPSTVTSDSGWGCMLRAAQMLMGHALQRHYLGTDWRIPPDVKASRAKKSRALVLSQNEAYCDMVSWFTDYPGWPHIYSIHHLVHCGMSKYDKTAGQWVGPSTAAYLLRDLARIHCALYGGTMEVLVTQGDTIYITEAETVCTRSAQCRAEYIESLHIRSNSNNSSAENSAGNSEDCADSAPDSTMLHPLLTPVPTRSDNIGTRMSETYDRCSEFASKVEPSAARITSTDNGRCTSLSGNTAPTTTAATETTVNPAPFFDPLLRPPPKLAPPWTSALLVLVPLMLGIHTVNQEYIEEIKSVLRHKHCVGIIGGRPNHAIYFVGYRGDTLLGLDPHTVFANPPPLPAPVPPPSAPQPHVPLSSDVSATASSCTSNGKVNGSSGAGRASSSDSTSGGRASYTRTSSHSRDSASATTAAARSKQQLGLGSTYSSTSEESFFSSALAAFTSSSTSDSDTTVFPSAEYLSQVHVSDFVALDISRLDSSLAIGFYFPSRTEFEKFCEETKIASTRKLKEGKYPLYSVQNAAPAFMYSDTQEYGSAKKSRRHSNTSTTSNSDDTKGDGGKAECSGSAEEVDKSRSFDPADTDVDLAGIPTISVNTTNTNTGRAVYSGGNSGVNRVVSEDSGDEDYVLV